MADITILKPGQKLAVLNDDDLTAGDFTTPFGLAAGYNGDALVTIINLSDSDILLSVSADGGVTFVSVTAFGGNGNLTIGTQMAYAISLSAGFIYALSSVDDLTAATIWVGR